MVRKTKRDEVCSELSTPRQGINSRAGAACSPLPSSSPFLGCTGPPGNPTESNEGQETRLDKMPNDHRS